MNRYTLEVDLGDRSYPIHIGEGLLGQADLFKPHVAGKVAMICTNTTVGPLYADRLKTSLLDAGAKHVIATQEEDLIAEVASITDGKGARIVFDPVGGPEATKLIKSMANTGIFFQYGALDHRDIPVPVFDILGKHLTVRGYELFEITMDMQKLANAKAFVAKGLAGGQLKPVIDQVFPLNEIAAAHRRMESNSQIGKIVVVVD